MRLHRFHHRGFVLAAAAASPADAQIEAQYVVTTTGGHHHWPRQRDLLAHGQRLLTIRSETRSDGALKAFLDDQYTAAEHRARRSRRADSARVHRRRRARDNQRDLKSTFDWKMSVMHTVLRGEPSDYWFPAGNAGPHLDHVPVRPR